MTLRPGGVCPPSPRRSLVWTHGGSVPGSAPSPRPKPAGAKSVAISGKSLGSAPPPWVSLPEAVQLQQQPHGIRLLGTPNANVQSQETAGKLTAGKGGDLPGHVKRKKRRGQGLWGCPCKGTDTSKPHGRIWTDSCEELREAGGRRQAPLPPHQGQRRDRNVPGLPSAPEQALPGTPPTTAPAAVTMWLRLLATPYERRVAPGHLLCSPGRGASALRWC